MKYMLAIYGDSSTWGRQSDDEAKAEQDAFATFEREAAAAGVLIEQAALQPEGQTLSMPEGGAQPTSGPLTNPERRLGCFYILDCRDLEDATKWGSRVPLVGAGGFDSIEIRPLIENSERER